MSDDRSSPASAPASAPAPAPKMPSMDFGTATTTVPRSPRSVRRTSHLDSIVDLPETAAFQTSLSIWGSARDLLTDVRGVGHELASAHIEASLDSSHGLTAVATQPVVDTSNLVGQLVGRGFRSTIDRAVPDELASRTPLYLLLDELPVMALISGYASLYTDRRSGDSARAGLKGDICSGWRTGGVMMNSIATVGRVPIPVGPSAAIIERADDALAWHPMEPLAPGAMRRRRLVEIRCDDTGNTARWTFYAYFRDSFRPSENEVEIVLHEYELTGALDDDGETVIAAGAEPRVLPWIECPHAAASASWIVGHRVDEIRALVRDRFRGTATCTHLNDLVRSLGDLDVLRDHVKKG
ncbi:MAG: DUF2889 domain-containing protein [Acidimicrobiia bacterium]